MKPLAPVFVHNQIDQTIRDSQSGLPIPNQSDYSGKIVVYDNYFPMGMGLFTTWVDVDEDSGVIERNWRAA